MRIVLLSQFTCVAMIATGCGQSDGQAKKIDEPAPKQVSELGKEVEIWGYVVRPPKGYPVVKPSANIAFPGTRLLLWGGKTRSDGTAPMFGVMVGSPPEEEKAPGSADEYLDIMLEAVKNQRDANTWKQSPFDEVRIGELVFKRTRWSGTDLKYGWKMHGTMYVAIDGRTYIQLMTQDVEPHHEDALKRGEAAAESFKKKVAR